jgi:hypothetical protein
MWNVGLRSCRRGAPCASTRTRGAVDRPAASDPGGDLEEHALLKSREAARDGYQQALNLLPHDHHNYRATVHNQPPPRDF